MVCVIVHWMAQSLIVEGGCQTNCCLVFLLNLKESSFFTMGIPNKLCDLLPGSPMAALTCKVHLTKLTYC